MIWKDTTMETFAFAAELISTISVIVSLIYLALSIRENTRSMRRAAGRDLLRDMNDLSRYFIQNQDLTELYLKSIENPQDLSAAQRFRIERLINYVFTSFQSALDYHNDKLIDNEVVDTYAQAIRPSSINQSLKSGGKCKVSLCWARSFET